MKKIVQTAGRTQVGEFAPKFVHLAFEIPGENTSNEWQEAVSDEEYNKTELSQVSSTRPNRAAGAVI